MLLSAAVVHDPPVRQAYGFSRFYVLPRDQRLLLPFRLRFSLSLCLLVNLLRALFVLGDEIRAASIIVGYFRRMAGAATHAAQEKSSIGI